MIRYITIKVILTLLSGLSFTSHSYAENVKRYKKTVKSETAVVGDHFRGPSFFIGLGGGYITSQSSNLNLESDKDGSIYSLLASLSWIEERFTADIGVGWNHSQMSGKLTPGSPVDTSKINMSFGSAETSIRYRLGRWELGPIISANFGTDTSFSPLQITTTSLRKINIFGGLAAYSGKFYWNNFGNRWGIQYLTDFEISGRQIHTLRLLWQFGIPLISEKPKIKTVEVVETVEKTKLYLIKKFKKQKSYYIDAGIINFPTGDDVITNQDKSFLADLGQYLLNNMNEWQEVIITGNADHRGSEEFNEKLALKRAETVIDAMGISHLSKDRFRIIGQGFYDPVESGENPESLARNRRVEIEISGPTATVKLKRTILKLRQKHTMPMTCKGSSCK